MPSIRQKMEENKTTCGEVVLEDIVEKEIDPTILDIAKKLRKRILNDGTNNIKVTKDGHIVIEQV